MCMSHGGMRQKPFNIYEEDLRVPLVFSNPYLFPEARVSDSFTSLVDVLPTLANVAGADVTGIPFDGHDLQPILTDAKAKVRDELFFMYDDQHTAAGAFLQTAPQPNHIRCLRDERWKYGYYFDPISGAEAEYELYDLAADPYEMNNVANDEAYQEQKAALQIRLEKKMDQFQAHPADLPDIFGPK